MKEFFEFYDRLPIKYSIIMPLILGLISRLSSDNLIIDILILILFYTLLDIYTFLICKNYGTLDSKRSR